MSLYEIAAGASKLLFRVSSMRPAVPTEAISGNPSSASSTFVDDPDQIILDALVEGPPPRCDAEKGVIAVVKSIADNTACISDVRRRSADYTRDEGRGLVYARSPGPRFSRAWLLDLRC